MRFDVMRAGRLAQPTKVVGKAQAWRAFEGQAMTVDGLFEAFTADEKAELFALTRTPEEEIWNTNLEGQTRLVRGKRFTLLLSEEAGRLVLWEQYEDETLDGERVEGYWFLAFIE